MKRAVIITSYMENRINAAAHLEKDDHVICTDGGYDIALSYGITPDLLLGDFDSVTAPLPDDIRIERFRPEKDYTDLDLALRTAVEEGFSEVMIWGGIGGRLDHTVANLQLLSHYSAYLDKLEMFDGMNRCFIISSSGKGRAVIPEEKDSYLSVFSLSERSCGVSIQGAKYELADYTLTRDFPLGVSNEFAEKNTIISVKDGTLLIVISGK